MISIKQTKYLVLELYYNKFKGSGKCWVANIDLETKKILSFVDAESVVKEGNHKGYKTFKLGAGDYMYCCEGTKSKDTKEYFQVEDGISIDL